MIAAVHKPVPTFRVLSRSAFEVEAPYPLACEFERQERLCEVAQQEGVPAQDLQVVAITDLRAEAMNQLLLIGLRECDDEHSPIGRQRFAMIDQSLSFSTASDSQSQMVRHRG
ncbi:hypothetical protein D9M70_603780 [compost metagenome]